ncbi:MAG: cadherin repeat domain-containing protein, partial [Cyclobacteriaceae bacterium]
VSLPYSLDFNSSVTATISDGADLGTGFTMILDHSQPRLAEDVVVSDPDVNGYEPSLLNLNAIAGQLEISSQAGIAYLDNNNQVNTLGVGLTNPTSTFIIRTTLANVATGGGSAQAGLWFGITDDDFAKLVVVNDNNIEFRVERDGASANNTTDQLLATGTGAFGNNVILELLVDPNASSATAYYTIAAGSKVELGTLTLPSDYFTGRTDVAALASTPFAGIFATHRSGTQFTAAFDDFEVDNSNLDPVISDQSFTVAGDAPLGQVVGQVAASDADGTIEVFSFDVASSVFAIDNSGLITVSGTPDQSSYILPVTITDNSGGSASADITVNVNPTTLPPEPFAGVLINFQRDEDTPPSGFLEDFGESYSQRTASEQGSGIYTYGWIDTENGNPISLVGQARNRGGTQNPLELRTTIHMNHPSTPPSGYWEIAVPNGLYEVTVSVGDQSIGSDPTVHRINAEGINIIDNFVPSSGNEFSSGTAVIEVLDGKLTLDYAGGGVNTKLNYASVQPYTNNAPQFPQTAYDFTISSDAAEGAFVGKAAAEDPELDPLTYVLTGTGAENFDVNSSGEITVAAG